MKKKNAYSVLAPIRVDTHRNTFLLSDKVLIAVNAFQVFEPTLNQFKKFACGRFFWFIVDLINWKHIDGGGEIENITPLKQADFIDADPQILHDITHFGDLPHVIAFSNFWVNYHTNLSEVE